MSRTFNRCWRFLLLPALAVSVFANGEPPRPSPASAATNSAAVEIRGRIAPGLGGSRDPLTFKTDAGLNYTLVSNQMSLALFVDTNLQSKSLLLKGRVQAGTQRAGTQRFEVTGNLRSIRDGKIHELYYYCDICAIKGSDPGPCMCCREPVYLVEEPR